MVIVSFFFVSALLRVAFDRNRQVVLSNLYFHQLSRHEASDLFGV